MPSSRKHNSEIFSHIINDEEARIKRLRMHNVINPALGRALLDDVLW